ncbi:hypothetical protein ACFL0Z_03230 [Patescibacteria group bacterium]
MPNHLPKKTAAKIKRREKKRKTKMKVSGKSVIELKKLIDKKSKRRKR